MCALNFLFKGKAYIDTSTQAPLSDSETRKIKKIRQTLQNLFFDQSVPFTDLSSSGNFTLVGIE